MSKTDRLYGWACGLLTLCCIVVTHPRVEMGINDDWSFIYSAKLLAATGHIHYNGWAAPILGVQLYLGALFIRMFGFSFTAVRASTMLISVVTVPLIHALLVRCGIRAWNATLGTLTLAVSPLYLPLATSYMTDNFALCGLVLFLYGCVRCVASEDERAAVYWLAAAAAAGLAAGSVRQIGWLSILVTLPCLVWQQRRRRTVLRAGVALWLLSLVAIAVMVHWFDGQPYVAVETLLDVSPDPFFIPVKVVKAAVSCMLLLCPVIFGIALRLDAARRLLNPGRVVILAIAGIAVGVSTYANGGQWLADWLLGEVTTASVLWSAGMVGQRTQVVPGWVQTVVALFIVASMSACVMTMRRKRGSPGVAVATRIDAALPWLVLPFTAASLVLIFTRSRIFDRYFLPLFLLAMICALRWFEREYAANLSRLCLLPLALLGGYGVAGTHDLFAEKRAVLAAADALRARGLSRTEFDAGFEYDGWTQIEQTGYVNESRIRPAGTYKYTAPPAGLKEVHPSDAFDWRRQPLSGQTCSTWFYGYTPSIHPKYLLEKTAGYCFTDSVFPAVKYRTWLPPYAGAISVAEVPEKFR